MRDEVESGGGNLFLFLGLFFLDLIVSALHLRNHLDHEWHDEVIHIESPGIFEGKIWLDILIASVESGSKEFLLFLFHKEFKQFLYNLLIV